MHSGHGDETSIHGRPWRRLVALSCLFALLMLLFGHDEPLLAATYSGDRVVMAADHGDAPDHHDPQGGGHCISGAQCAHQAVLPAVVLGRQPLSIPARPIASDTAEGRAVSPAFRPPSLRVPL